MKMLLIEKLHLPMLTGSCHPSCLEGGLRKVLPARSGKMTPMLLLRYVTEVRYQKPKSSHK